MALNPVDGVWWVACHSVYRVWLSRAIGVQYASLKLPVKGIIPCLCTRKYDLALVYSPSYYASHLFGTAARTPSGS